MILLAKNVRLSAGKNSKHIKNRFFLITHKVAQGDIKIEHKVTDEMWGDVNTKPTQIKGLGLCELKLWACPSITTTTTSAGAPILF